MAGDFVPWLIGLESGAKVVVGGNCPIPRDTLSDWARPGEGLRPLDNDETSWLLRVVRREFQEGIWTLIGFYDSGREFQGSRPHAFVGAGVIARDLLVPGVVLDALRTMVDTWQQEIDQSGRNVEATAAPVWSNDAVRNGLDRLERGLLVSEPGAGLQPGSGSHFFHVSESDLGLLENAIRDLQSDGPFPAQSILFSSSLDLHRKAQELGYGTHSAESFPQWRAAQTASAPEQGKRTRRGLIDSLAEPGQPDPAGDGPKKTTPGLAFTNNETTVDTAPVPPLPLESGANLRSTVLDLRGRMERLAAEAEAVALLLGRVSDAMELRKQVVQVPLARRFTPRKIALAVTGGIVVLAAIFFLLRFFESSRKEPSGRIDLKAEAQSVPVPPQPPAATSPVDFVFSYYGLLEKDPDEALALRGIPPESSAGLRIVNSRFQNYQSYEVTDLKASDIRPTGNRLTSIVIGRIAAVTRAGERLGGNVEVKIEADLPLTGAAPQWRIMSLREDSAAIRL